MVCAYRQNEPKILREEYAVLQIQNIYIKRRSEKHENFQIHVESLEVINDCVLKAEDMARGIELLGKGIEAYKAKSGK